MAKLFQIYEEDLEELERVIPDLAISLSPHLGPRQRTQLRNLKEILSNIRWDYGPHTDVTIIPAGDGGDDVGGAGG